MGRGMAFKSGDFEYVAGNLAAAPRLGRFPAGDGTYSEVVWMTLAVNHGDGTTEYVELEARGKTKEYVKNMARSDSRPLAKGSFVMAGGTPGKTKNGRRKLRVSVLADRTSLDYDVLDWDYLKQ
ncbi:hypothetical protein DDF78_04125 [Bifidobacterium tibiigranuli]|jgi:hypothetical protein|nr:hypothetical protein DDF78_04125 [Bifidobacterium tibiigranuli]